MGRTPQAHELSFEATPVVGSSGLGKTGDPAAWEEEAVALGDDLAVMAVAELEGPNRLWRATVD